MAGTCQDLPCDPACAEGEVCDVGSATCQCAGGASCGASETCCTDGCQDTQNDPMNCGGCGVACPPGQVCTEGGCGAVPCDPPCGPGLTCNDGVCGCGTGGPCTAGQSCCAGVCVDTQSSTANCGSCGRACGADEGCCNGGCRNLRTNPDHCGTCNDACGSSADECVDGVCRCQGGAECLVECIPLVGCFPA